MRKIPFKIRLKWAISKRNRDGFFTKLLVILGVIITPTLLVYYRDTVYIKEIKEIDL